MDGDCIQNNINKECTDRIPLAWRTDRVAYLFRWTQGMAESLTPSQFWTLKGSSIVAQGQRVSAPPWVEVTPELTPLPHPQVFGPVKRAPRAGERGKGSGG